MTCARPSASFWSVLFVSACFPAVVFGRGGDLGMIGVDLIGDIRRAYFEQQRPIKEIVRTLSVSRATVRRVIRSQKTAFAYERSVQPAPKLGVWVSALIEILEKGSQAAAPGASVDATSVRRTAWPRLRRRARQRASFYQGMA